MATIKDIALRAEVNISTVSRALKGTGDMSPATRERIIRIAQELNYVSNKNEKEYTRSSARTIGLICPEIKSNFYIRILDALDGVFREAGYTITLGITNFKPEQEIHYLNAFASKGVDGIVLLLSDASEKICGTLAGFRAKSGIPLVQVPAGHALDDYDSVSMDNGMVVRIAVEHLYHLGHREVGYIGEELTRDRFVRFSEAVREHGMTLRDDHVVNSTERMLAAGYNGMTKILASGSIPSAIFAAYDYIAIGAIRAASEHGLRVPEDLSVMGVDDIDVSPYMVRSLTTISNPCEEIGDIAAQLLIGKMRNKGKSVIQHIAVKPVLIARESTAPLGKISDII